MNISKPYSAHDFSQIHQLNYETFVEEIPQHSRNAERLLVDKFHHKNRYFIAKSDSIIQGMVCYNLDRPFSLDLKIKNLDSFLPTYTKLGEVRLLAVKMDERGKLTAYRLLKALCTELIQLNVDTVVISGTTRQLPLYKKMGFTQFGPLVGSKNALYQPMYITINNLRDDFKSN